jgi:hypothetical protein
MGVLRCMDSINLRILRKMKNYETNSISLIRTRKQQKKNLYKPIFNRMIADLLTSEGTVEFPTGGTQKHSKICDEAIILTERDRGQRI